MRGLFLSAVLTLSCFGAAAAHADSLSFNFTGGAAGYSGSGSLMATSTSTAGQYTVTGMAGGGGGGFIVGLLAPGTITGHATNDNLLFPGSSSVFDTGGLAFLISAGTDTFQVDLFSDSSSPSGYSAFFRDEDGSTGTVNLSSFALTSTAAAAPEPSSFALLGTALLGIGLLGNAGLRRQRFTPATHVRFN